MKLEWADYHNHSQLLEKIDQMKVWSNILGFTPKLNQFILNPLRPDKHLGSCYLERKGDKIILVDWADKRFSGHDCISAYLVKYPKPWAEACIELLKTSSLEAPSVSYMALPGLKVKTKELIPIYRNWEKRDKVYWEKRGISKTQLERKETLTLPIKGYILIKDTKQEVYFGDLAYAFHCNEKVKLYFPERKQFRFIGTTGRTDVWHLNRGSDTLLVTKSQKELLVWENLVNWDLTHVQNESFSQEDSELVYKWEVGYDKILLNFDNDLTGIKAMQTFTSKFLFKEVSYFHIDPATGIKDIDQMMVEWGSNETLDYIQTLI